MTNELDATDSGMPEIISIADLRKQLKTKSDVLWPHRENVENGTVLYVRGDSIDLIWLEGYKSRNDTVDIGKILAIHDPKGPSHEMSPFEGKGYLTAAGVKWLAEHPPEPNDGEGAPRSR